MLRKEGDEVVTVFIKCSLKCFSSEIIINLLKKGPVNSINIMTIYSLDSHFVAAVSS